MSNSESSDPRPPSGVISVSWGPGSSQELFLTSVRSSGSSPATGRSGARTRVTRILLPVAMTSSQDTKTAAAKANANRYNSQVPTTRPAR